MKVEGESRTMWHWTDELVKEDRETKDYTKVDRLDCSPFIIGVDAVEPKVKVSDLGLTLDRDLSMLSHVTGLVRTSFVILRQLRSSGWLRSVSRSLTQDVTSHLVQSLILSWIDYCNVALAGLPEVQYDSASGGHQRCSSSGRPYC